MTQLFKMYGGDFERCKDGEIEGNMSEKRF
jgi:hypothetical protein